MDADQEKRLGWIELYQATGDAGLVCRRCGISRPTLRKWQRRYDQAGVDGLRSQSRRPHRSPRKKVFEREERLIVRLRLERRLGIKQLRSELIRRHDLRLSLETVHKVLERHGVNVLERKRSWRKRSKRYVRPVSGDRVLMDVCQIAPALYPYTAIDDCSRYADPDGPWPRVLHLQGPATPHGIGDQASVTPSERQGQAQPEDRSAGVLVNRRSEGSRSSTAAGRMAALLQLASTAYGPERPFTH